MAHWHTVRQGESIPSIAERYGFADWKTVYEHAQNDYLRQKRSNPYVLAVGDQVFIPGKEQKYVTVATEQRHRFQLKRRMEQVHVVLEDEEGEPFAHMDYRLQVGNLTFHGNTGSTGLVEQEVPAIADQAVLTVWHDPEQPEATWEWVLDVGHLDPVETVTGVQARLANLGYRLARTGTFDEPTQQALASFQEAEGLEVTGQVDAVTRDRLVEVYGS
ncbi:hypothetical protein AWN76_001520 [Rhodothermaceae bacterium RA]|nr:hypothetical protein AWN76_001520 [Rhodothermaceae bacterium RA]